MNPLDHATKPDYPTPVDRRLSVTVISGFVGAGKTALVQHLVSQDETRRLAALLQTLDDQRSVEASQAVSAEGSDALSGGPVFFRSSGDSLSRSVSSLALQRRFDVLIIELSPTTEPLLVAELFTVAEEAGDRHLYDLARLDTFVTVVDAGRFLSDWNSEDDLRHRELVTDQADIRSVAELLGEQIEFANVIVLNKVDLVSSSHIEKLRAVLHALNPEAQIVPCIRGKVSAHEILNTGLFDATETSQSAGWLKVIREEGSLEVPEHGISNFVFRARRPFNPQRLHAFFNEQGEAWTGVLRSKGVFWLATRPELIGVWSQAGGCASFDPGARWYAAAPLTEWPRDHEARAQIQRDWREPWGDRRQELAFIGVDMDEVHLRAALNACLLTEAEWSAGPESWIKLDDPFGDWENAT